ncbi:MAG: hypothetical protein KC613_15295 [Myxococcales bacterium]|nr:hypothetical protein [Myxococcales bacterium]MCB9522106.1 hypothetical protein [Myxococcales bacterium]
MRIVRFAGLVALLGGLSACGSSRNTEIFSQQRVLEKTGDAQPLVDQAAEAWKGREDRAKAEAAVKLWEQAAQMDPTRADIQLSLAYAYYFMCNVHLRWDDKPDDAMKTTYKKGYEAGRNAVWLAAPEFAERIKKGEKWESAVKDVDAKAVPGLYWYATNIGKWALLDGFTTILAEKDHIAATMGRILELDEGFFHGAPHRYFGVYRTKIPFPGGDLPASKSHFEKAIGLDGNYLDTKVLFAESYAVKEQDEDLFKKLLGEVVAAPDDAIPELIPENKNAKRVAQKLLSDIDEYF